MRKERIKNDKIYKSWSPNSTDTPLIAYICSLGINIPHYCYHHNLSIAGNCRVCIVELLGVNKPVVSCAISAAPTIKNHTVFYSSALVKKARENVIEFLLVNHPIDCPVCDQAGSCDLQDQSTTFGIVKRRFFQFKRAVSDKNLGPVIKTVMTRCIHCTRCVRFLREIAGAGELGMLSRGKQSEIGTYVNKTVLSEISGNVIDLCPVGKLLFFSTSS